MKSPVKMEATDQMKLMLAYLCISTEIESSLPRKVQILDQFALTDAEIARVCSCSVPSVANARLAAKKKS